MSSLLDRITNDRPKATAKVTLAFDPTEGRKLSEATLRRNSLKSLAGTQWGDPAALAEAEADVEAAKAGLDTFTITLRGIGPARVRELMLEHPPTKEQIKTRNVVYDGDPSKKAQFNEDTFPPALLSEMVVRIEASDGSSDPMEGLSLEEATRLWDAEWSKGDKDVLMGTAMLLDTDTSLVEDVGKD